MIKISSHYFHRLDHLQIMVYSVLIVGTLIVSLTMQAGAGMFNLSAIIAGVIRGALMAVGILAVNFALGLYEHPSKLTVGRIHSGSVVVFFFHGHCQRHFVPLAPSVPVPE